MGFLKILIENSLCPQVFHLTDDNTCPIEGSRCGGKNYNRSKRSRDNALLKEGNDGFCTHGSLRN